MTVDLHSAVRTAVDEARRLATAAKERYFIVANLSNAMGGNPNPVTAFSAWWGPSRALAMCDWADDVLARHAAFTIEPPAGYSELKEMFASEPQCRHGRSAGIVIDSVAYPCAELISVAAAFGVETGETP